jgi:hypothetical protein
MDKTIYIDARARVAKDLQAFVDTECHRYVDDDRVPGEFEKIFKTWSDENAENLGLREDEVKEIHDKLHEEVAIAMNWPYRGQREVPPIWSGMGPIPGTPGW